MKTHQSHLLLAALAALAASGAADAAADAQCDYNLADAAKVDCIGPSGADQATCEASPGCCFFAAGTGDDPRTLPDGSNVPWCFKATAPPAPAPSTPYTGKLAGSFVVSSDSPTPDFLAYGTQLFDVTEADVSVQSNNHAYQNTKYSTNDDSRAKQLAVSFGIKGGEGPFSAAASMKVGHGTDEDVKTVRLDKTSGWIKESVSSVGAFNDAPWTFLKQSHKDLIATTSVDNVTAISDKLGYFFARKINRGGLITRSFTKQATTDDTQSSFDTEIQACHVVCGNGGVEGDVTTSTTGAKMNESVSVMGGDGSLWSSSDDFATIEGKWQQSVTDDNLYDFVAVSDPSSVTPIWELVQGIDKAKGDALQKALTEQWATQVEPVPDKYFEPDTYFTISITDDHEATGPASNNNTFNVKDAYRNKLTVTLDGNSFPGKHWTTTASVKYTDDPKNATFTCENPRWSGESCDPTTIDLTIGGTTIGCQSNSGEMKTYIGVTTTCSVTVSGPSMEELEAAAAFDEGEPAAAAATASLRGAIRSVSDMYAHSS